MRQVLMVLVSVAVLAGCDKIVTDPASLEDVGKVLDALRAAGCTGLTELEVERGGGFEVDGVVCADGNRYDIELDKAFNIVSKRRDYF